MTEVSPQSRPSPQDDSEGEDETSRFPIGRLLWAVAPLAFLAYVVFGSVSARIWRFNRLYFEDRRILEIWRYEGRNLPDVPLQDAVTVLYYGAVVALFLATVLGLWYLLDDTGFRPQSRASSSERHPAAHE